MTYYRNKLLKLHLSLGDYDNLSHGDFFLFYHLLFSKWEYHIQCIYWKVGDNNIWMKWVYFFLQTSNIALLRRYKSTILLNTKSQFKSSKITDDSWFFILEAFKGAARCQKPSGIGIWISECISWMWNELETAFPRALKKLMGTCILSSQVKQL